MPRARYRVVEIPGRKPFVQTYTPKAADKRKDAVAQTWRNAGHGTYQQGVYVVLWAVFYFPRPKTHLDVHGSVKASYLQRRPASRGASRNGQRTGGDVDNCLKLVMDALSGVAYHDDAQIVRLEGEKRYVDQGQAPGVSQTVIGIDPVTAPTPESETDPGGSVPAAAGVAAGIRSAGKPT